MAAFETTRPLTAGQPFASRFGGMTVGFFGALAAWNDARRTRNTLNALSDHELGDIGLVRGDIEEIAARR